MYVLKQFLEIPHAIESDQYFGLYMCKVSLRCSFDTWLTFSPGTTWNFPLFSPPHPLSQRNVGPNKKHCLIQLTLLKMHSHSCWSHVRVVLFLCLHMYNKSSTVQVFMKF